MSFPRMRESSVVMLKVRLRSPSAEWIIYFTLTPVSPLKGEKNNKSPFG
jgi:hypothetical protein